MTTPVAAIDTSALLAFLNQETGWEAVEAWLDRGVVASTLIVQELTSKLVQKGASREEAVVTVSELGLATADLTMPLAFLALARSLNVPAVTADRPWADVADDLGVTVGLIR